jgi:casein kinase 1
LTSSVNQGQSQILAQIQNAGLNNSNPQRRDDRQHRDSERRRVSQAGPGGVIPPSPALVRRGSKQRKIPAALTPGSGNTPGQVTPLSAAAQINVPVATPIPGRSSQGGAHPYASAAPGGYDYGGDESYRGQQYGRASPMVPSVGAAPPAISPVRVRGDVGASHGEDFRSPGLEVPKSSLWRILTCRCG